MKQKRPPTAAEKAIRHAQRSRETDRSALQIVLAEMWHALGRSKIASGERRIGISIDEHSIVRVAFGWIKGGHYYERDASFTLSECSVITVQELLRPLSKP